MRPDEQTHDEAVAVRTRQIARKLPPSDAAFIVTIVELYQRHIRLSEKGRGAAMDGWCTALDGRAETNAKAMEQALRNLRRAQINAAVWAALLFVSLVVLAVRS